MVNYSSIKQLHLEISTRCNASCPLCPRNIAGFDTDLGYPIHDMRLEEARKIFPPAFLQQLEKVLINGNFGDFVTARDNLKIVQYFAEQNPQLQIEISTNASAKPDMWSKLGKIPNVTVGFAIDGLKDTHSLYRKNTDWDLIISNAKKFIAAGGKAKWRMIQFDHNKHQRDECEQLSKDLGFIEFDLVYDGRDTGPVYDRKGDFDYVIGNDLVKQNNNYPAKAETWEAWTVVGAMPSVRRKQYLQIKPNTKVDCYSNKFSEIYVTATGEVYPCCWLGFYPNAPFKHAWQSDLFQVAEAINSNNNALEVGIESAVEWFASIEKGWELDNYSEGRLFLCDQMCGK